MTDFYSPEDFSRRIIRKKGKLALTFDRALSQAMADAKARGAGVQVAKGMVGEYAYRTCYRQYHEAIQRAKVETTVQAHTGTERSKDGAETQVCYLTIKVPQKAPEKA